jgi:hypothetical protein
MTLFVRIALALGLWAILVVRADEMTLGDRTVRGVFTGFGKGQFRFQTWDGQALAERAMNVRKLILDEPVAVLLETRSRKEAEGVQLKGYESGQFRIVRGARDAVERESQVQSVTVRQSEHSFAEYMQRAKQAEEEAEGAAGPIPDRLDELVAMGKVSVIHFHQPDSVTSIRQGSYCQRLAKDSRGRVVYRRLTLDGPDDPAMLRFGLTTLPQFWFYSRGGKLVTKLTERFTPADFEQALDLATRGTSREGAE